MYKFTQGILPLVMLLQKLPFFFNDYYYSELNCDSCVKVLYTKKYKFETKIEYVQDKILLLTEKLYTGIPVTSVTNSRSAEQRKWPEMSTNSVKRPFLPEGPKEALAEGQSPPQDLEVSPCSGLYLLVIIKC